MLTCLFRKWMRPNRTCARWYRILVLGLVWFCAQTVPALEGDRALFPEKLAVGEVTLARQGVGRMRRWMITGVDMALYVPAGTRAEDILGDIPRALSFYYYVSIRGEQFDRAARETLAQNVSADELAQYAEQITTMGSWFATVERGDRYLLSYQPGRGTVLALNGEEIGVIPGAEFARIYFQIWLGEDPIDARMYRALTAGMP